MNNNLSFQRTLAGSLGSNVDAAVWDKVMQQYDAGKYADAIRDCINYVDATIEKRFANPERTEYNVPHGSVIVQLKITEKALSINAPFLNIEDSKKIPLLRQVAQINFSPLTISQIDLDDDKLYFNFFCPLDACEPYKIYDVLREICINADNYDDEFITKFNAARIQEPKIYPYTIEQKNVAWSVIQQNIIETFAAYEQLENKRLTGYLWDILMITILKIDYFCAPQGNIRSEIEKTIICLNGKDDYYRRLSVAKEFLKKLQTYDRAKFENDLYKIDAFVPYKLRPTLEGVRNGLKYAHETADKEIKVMDFTGATFTMEFGILNFFYSNNVEDAVTEVLTKAMEQVSGKPMNEAAKILYDAINLVMTKENFALPQPPTAQPEQKGFFKKLFG